MTFLKGIIDCHWLWWLFKKLISKERGRERQRKWKGEKNIFVRTNINQLPPARDWVHYLGKCSDQKLNWQPFGTPDNNQLRHTCLDQNGFLLSLRMLWYQHGTAWLVCSLSIFIFSSPSPYTIAIFFLAHYSIMSWSILWFSFWKSEEASFSSWSRFSPKFFTYYYYSPFFQSQIKFHFFMEAEIKSVLSTAILGIQYIFLPPWMNGRHVIYFHLYPTLICSDRSIIFNSM